MAQGWTTDQDDLLKHLIVTGYQIQEAANIIGKSRSTCYNRWKDLQKNGWDGHTDPLSGQKPQGTPEPQKPGLFKRAIRSDFSRRIIDSNLKKGSFIHKVVSRRIFGDTASGDSKSGAVSSAKLLDAINSHHRAQISNLNNINANIMRGTSSVSRSVSNMSDRITTVLDRVSQNMDRQSYGTHSPNVKQQAQSPSPQATQSPAQASMYSKLSGLMKGKGKTVAKVAGGALALGGAGLAASMLMSNRANASTNPNDKVDPNDKGNTNPVDRSQENSLRTEDNASKDNIKKSIPELEIKGENLKFKGHVITFEADEFDLSALFGKKGKGSAEEGFKDGVAPPDPGDKGGGSGGGGSTNGSQGGTGSNNGSPNAGAAASGFGADGAGGAAAGPQDSATGGSGGGSGGSGGGFMDKIKDMLGLGGSKGGGHSGGHQNTVVDINGKEHPMGDKDSSKPAGPGGDPNVQPESRNSQGQSQGFTPLPSGTTSGGGSGSGGGGNSPTAPAGPPSGDSGGGSPAIPGGIDSLGGKLSDQGIKSKNDSWWNKMGFPGGSDDSGAPKGEPGNPTGPAGPSGDAPQGGPQSGALSTTDADGTIRYNSKLPQLGLNTDKFTPDAKPGDGVGGGAGYMAGKRAGYAQELQDPATRKLLGAVISSENPGAGPAVAESLMNRTDLVNESRAAQGKAPLTLKDMMVGHPSIGGGKSFYNPIRNGAINDHLNKMNNPKFAEQMNQRIDQALGGSNTIKNYTDQGSFGDPNYDSGGVGININKERFNDWGYKGAKQFRERRQKEYDAAEAASKQNANKVAGPGGPSTPPVTDKKVSPVDAGVPSNMLDKTPMKSQTQTTMTVDGKTYPMGQPTASVGKPVTDAVPYQDGTRKDSVSGIDGEFSKKQGNIDPNEMKDDWRDSIQPRENPANSDFGNKSEINSFDQMQLQKPVINDQGAVGNDGSSGRSPQTQRSDLQDVDKEMVTAMKGHYDGGDFPGLGDQDNSDTDTGFA